MDDFFANLDLNQILSSGGFLGGLLLAFRMVQRSSTAAIHTLESATAFDASRIDRLEAHLLALEQRVGDERRLKHDWRSFATSMLLERATIRHTADINGCDQVVTLMDRLDAMRRDNPLMVDLRNLTEGDPNA